MALKNMDVKIKFAYVRLKRKLAFYFTLWFFALLAGVGFIIYAIFVSKNAAPLKIWSIVLVIIFGVKLAYDTVEKMKREYNDFKRDEGIKTPTISAP
jgi:cytochrome c biogenesis protein CcdA